MTLQQFLDTLCLWHAKLTPVDPDYEPSCPECSSDLDTKFCHSCAGEFLTDASCDFCEKIEGMWAEYAEEMSRELSSSFPDLTQAKLTT